jgi:hypothetical protein
MIDDQEWQDLTNASYIDAYEAQQIIVLNSSGAGRAVLVHLRDARSGTVYEFCLTKEIATSLGWELIGHAQDLVAKCFPELFDELDEEES